MRKPTATRLCFEGWMHPETELETIGSKVLCQSSTVNGPQEFEEEVEPSDFSQNLTARLSQPKSTNKNTTILADGTLKRKTVIASVRLGSFLVTIEDLGKKFRQSRYPTGLGL
ncbi:hypothetical protein EG329_000225 [Mollisiaceae sp. DMI_Dod_QoI]|nr:hypothetical protein EG329_000225 [Helotiales sp. DMI_Dod_QoI]